MSRTGTLPFMVLAVVVTYVTGCAEKSTGPERNNPALRPAAEVIPALIVSQPFGRAFGATRASASSVSSALSAAVVYISLPPGSVPEGLEATIRDLANGLSVTTAVVNGGFDPVALAANVGDTLAVEITRTGSAAPIRAMQLVSAHRPPVVVRTTPPPGQADVPLNSMIVVVFSQPIDTGTVTTQSVQLRVGAASVVGTVGFSDRTDIKAEFHPADLLTPRTAYRLVLTQAIRDVNGVALESSVEVPFTTGTELSLAFAAVSAGLYETCGVTTAGAAYCWGEALHLSLRPPYMSATPAALAGGLRFAMVSAGYLHDCGVTTGGAAYCWGLRRYGQLGIDSSTASTCISQEWCAAPVAVAGGRMFKTVTTGAFHTCGVTTDGAAYCWGSNLYGVLGAGNFNSGMTPVAVAGGLTFADVSTSETHTCGITTTGNAYCWGSNYAGELGTATTIGPCVDGQPSSLCSPVPAAVAGGLTFKAVSAGFFHTCGVTTSGAAYCWGDNSTGQLGTGTTTPSSTPVAVAGGLTFATVSAGYTQTCGVTTGGAAYCWGTLAGGTTAGAATPVAVPGGLTFVAVSASNTESRPVFHACGVTTDGGAYCWGANFSGQLGDGTRTSSIVPVKVAGQP